MRDKKKRNALFYAVESQTQNVDVVQELINRKADVNAISINGVSPLLLAAEKRHSRVISMLLQNGADIKFQGDEPGNSALHVACLQNDLKSVKSLIEYCFKSMSEDDQ